MKTKNFFKNEVKAMIAILFAAVMSLSFSACSENDAPVSPSLSDKLVGMWISETDAQGAIGEGDDALEYCKIVRRI